MIESKKLKLFEEETSGLEWSRNIGSMSWHKASFHIECVHGWRLPTIDELKHAYNEETEGFDEHSFWTSNMIDQRLCWVFSFKGEVRKEQKMNHCYTRFCRNKN
jgi:hypothetical protein